MHGTFMQSSNNCQARNAKHQVISTVACVICVLLLPASAVGQPFTTVINLPGDAAPSTLESDTQLNVLDGGFLEVVSEIFHVGNPDGSSSNVELNLVEDGRILTRGFFSGLRVQAGGQINISGGDYQGDLRVMSGATARVTGGLLAPERRGDQLDIVADTGSDVLISGGEILSEVTVLDGSSFVQEGGGIRLLDIDRDANAILRGGVVETIINGNVNGMVTFQGGEFRRNGVLIPELQSTGSSVNIQGPLAPGESLSGTLADGTPFYISEFVDGVNFERGTITLETVEIAPLQPGVFRPSGGPIPRGYRAGQTLVVDEDLPEFRAAAGPGSTIEVVAGGSLPYLEANGATLSYLGGIHSSVPGSRIVAYDSQIKVMDGFFPGGQLLAGSNLEVRGGVSGLITLGGRSEATVSGGSIFVLDVLDGSSAEVSGGEFSRLTTGRGGQLVVQGGQIDLLTADVNARIQLVGREFFIDDEPIAGLADLGTARISQRNVTLSGTLADGSEFSFHLDPSRARLSERFDLAARLTVTLIPEPATLTLVGLSAFCHSIVCRRHRRKHGHRVIRRSRLQS